MNIFLKTAKMKIKNKNPIPLEQISIRGNNIRLIILPDTINLDNLLQDTTIKPPPKNKPKPTTNVKKTFKTQPKKVQKPN